MAGPHRDEIARLELLHAAHPDGLIFPHLADAYRRIGELERAEDILTDGLRRFSDHSSAHVVLARVRLAKGEAEPARRAFEKVLELDPQNRIALRHLAELARSSRQPAEEREYYRQLHRLEPGDDQIAERLAQLDSELDDAASARPAGPAEAARERRPAPPPPEGPRGAGNGTPRPPPRPPEPEPSDRGGSEAITEEDYVRGLPRSTDPAGVPDPPSPAVDSDPAEVTTETMAEVYARQGLYDRASAIYRKLLRTRPDDARLEAKLADVDRQRQEALRVTASARSESWPWDDERATGEEPDAPGAHPDAAGRDPAGSGSIPPEDTAGPGPSPAPPAADFPFLEPVEPSEVGGEADDRVDLEDAIEGASLEPDEPDEPDEAGAAPSAKAFEPLEGARPVGDAARPVERVEGAEEVEPVASIEAMEADDVEEPAAPARPGGPVEAEAPEAPAGFEAFVTPEASASAGAAAGEAPAESLSEPPASSTGGGADPPDGGGGEEEFIPDLDWVRMLEAEAFRGPPAGIPETTARPPESGAAEPAKTTSRREPAEPAPRKPSRPPLAPAFGSVEAKVEASPESAARPGQSGIEGVERVEDVDPVGPYLRGLLAWSPAGAAPDGPAEAGAATASAPEPSAETPESAGVTPESAGAAPESRAAASGSAPAASESPAAVSAEAAEAEAGAGAEAESPDPWRPPERSSAGDAAVRASEPARPHGGLRPRPPPRPPESPGRRRADPEVESSVVALADLLVGLLEYRDPFFRGSSSLTRQLAEAVGRELGVDEASLRNLSLAAVLRDLGRLALGGRLAKSVEFDPTPDFRRRIERHVDLALQLLEGIELPREITLAVRHHHERWDGAGYPDALSGRDIPLPARILAVADSFAAMVSARSYRLPRKVPEAAAEMQDGAGSQYDPEVVNALIRVLAQRDQPDLGFVLRHHIVVMDSDQPGATVSAAKLCSAGYLAEVVLEAETAWERMRRVPVAAVVVAADLTDADPGKLIRRLRKDPLFAALPVVVTSAATVQQRVELLAAGADVCFAPDVSFAELQGTLGALVRRTVHIRGDAGEAAPDSPWLALRGDIKDFPLTWLLQVMKYDSRTATIAIRSATDQGIIHLQGGDPHHAQIRAGPSGEQGLKKMLGWAEGQFTVHPGSESTERTIHTPVTHLLLDQAVAADHAAASVFGAVMADE